VPLGDLVLQPPQHFLARHQLLRRAHVAAQEHRPAQLQALHHLRVHARQVLDVVGAEVLVALQLLGGELHQVVRGDVADVLNADHSKER